ncbi:MAG: hypothetical protein JNL13_04055, partial [Chitinophagaceae bacterium]|nr:hypothetical protein [Chitinophagaceae bacterium]
MKKLFFIMLTMICGLSLHAQVKLQWTTTTPTRFTINNTNSAISANGTTSFGHYGNSTQKLGVSKNGYIEFNVLHPGATGYYDIGFASASNPGSLIVGFHLVDGGSGTIAIGANGTAFNPFAPTGVYYPPCSCYYYESSGTGASCNPGDRLRIERVNNIVRFWNVTTNTELFFLVPTATAFTVAPTSDWTAFFGNSSPTTPVSGVNTASTSFSGLGLNGDDNLWLRTAADAIRPVLLSDKVGIGKEATVELDVQGKTKISALSGTGSMVIEALSTGELVRKRLSTADSVLGGDGNWILKPVSKWQYAATPAGSIYFQPAANPYVGINLNTPAANLDI